MLVHWITWKTYFTAINIVCMSWHNWAIYTVCRCDCVEEALSLAGVPSQLWSHCDHWRWTSKLKGCVSSAIAFFAAIHIVCMSRDYWAIYTICRCDCVEEAFSLAEIPSQLFSHRDHWLGTGKLQICISRVIAFFATFIIVLGDILRFEHACWPVQRIFLWLSALFHSIIPIVTGFD